MVQGKKKTHGQGEEERGSFLGGARLRRRRSPQCKNSVYLQNRKKTKKETEKCQRH